MDGKPQKPGSGTMRQQSSFYRLGTEKVRSGEVQNRVPGFMRVMESRRLLRHKPPAGSWMRPTGAAKQESKLSGERDVLQCQRDQQRLFTHH